VSHAGNCRGGRQAEDLDGVRTHDQESHVTHERQTPRSASHVFALYRLQGKLTFKCVVQKGHFTTDIKTKGLLGIVLRVN